MYCLYFTIFFSDKCIYW